MSLKPNRPAPLPPTKYYKPTTTFSAFDPYAKNDDNNNKTSNLLNRPTVIRPSSNQVKKKPPPRPAPPKPGRLVRKNAIKRTKSSVSSPTPDLLADLQDIFGPPKPHPSPALNRPSFKKSRAPQPQWTNKANEGSLIDFSAPSPIHQSNSTPSFTCQINKTLLDEDLPNYAFSSEPTASSSLQDLLSIKINGSDVDPFQKNVRQSNGTWQSITTDSSYGSARKTDMQSDPFGDFSLTTPNEFRCTATLRQETSTLCQDPFQSSITEATSNKDEMFGSVFRNPFISSNAAAETPKNGMNICSSARWESTPENVATEQWSSDHFFSPPEPKHPPPPPPPEVCSEKEKCYVALYDFQAQTTDELSFVVGDTIFLEEEVTCDWWKGQLNGRSGLFPANYVEKANTDSAACDSLPSDEPAAPPDAHCYATALYTFHAEQEGDLSFKEGDVIEVLYRINQDWLFGKYQNKEGQFPANFVRKLSTEMKVDKAEVIANYAFKGEKGDELTFREGDLIVLVENISSDWSKGYLKSDQSRTVGHFPSAFTSPTIS